MFDMDNISSSSPLVSIVVPMYKVEDYLPQCLDSILAQTYSNLEVVCVDDGSPDASGRIAEEYTQKDGRIRVVHQQNKGFSGARNAGLELITGDYVTFVDSDDYLAPDFVEYMLHIITSQQAEMAISKNCFTTADLEQVKQDRIYSISSEEAVAEFFLPYMRLGSWNKIYDRSFIEKHHLRFVPQLTTGEGLQFITLAASLAKKIGVGERKVYVYRINNPTSATTLANVEKQGIGAMKTLKYIEEHLPLRSHKEREAFAWHKWASYKYCLHHIVEAHAKEVYPELYAECKRKLRSGAWGVICSGISLREKAVAFVELISPTFFARLQAWKKQRRIQRK